MGHSCSVDAMSRLSPRLSSSGKGRSRSVSSKGYFVMTEIQKQLIVDTWANIDDVTKFAQTVFVRIFAAKPTLKRLFKLETVAADQLTGYDVFVKHAKAFGNFLTLIIGNLQHDEWAVVRLAQKLGAGHVEFCRGTSFDMKYFLIFAQSVVDEVENEQLKIDERFHHSPMTTNIKVAWSTFLDQIVDLISKGYYNAKHSPITKIDIQTQ